MGPLARPWRIGLRPRLLAALVATSAATLLAAAAALLSPLQERLREQTARTLQAAALTARPNLERALRGDEAVEPLLATLAIRTDARVRLVDTTGAVVADTDPFAPMPPLDQVLALRALRVEHSTRAITDEAATSAILLRPRGERRRVLVVRKPFTDVERAVDEVRDAFAVAALVGLAVAIVLGLALTSTLLRRLARLRQAAARISTGGEAAPLPPDLGRDEIGEVARALAAMQESLLRQEEARRSFVATASHELRTPLTWLRGTLELLDEDLREGRVDLADAHEQVVGAQAQLGRLEHLAADLLDLSRLDAETPLRSEPVELDELCRAVAAEFELRAAGRDVRLQLERPPGPCWGRGDPTAVARIVRILLDNALRFAPPGTPVRIEPAYHGPSATVEVADLGPGVPPDERERIFERFRRGSVTSVEDGAPASESGFGLGLAIGRELARRLGGDLELLNPGARGGSRGAVFRLSLPIELPAGSSARTADDAVSSTPLR